MGRTASEEDVKRFEEFWRHYPRKVAKPVAFKAWMREVNGDQEKVIAWVEAMKKIGWQDEQFIPHPSTFLNQRRWEDPLPQPKKREDRNERNRKAIEEGTRNSAT